MAERSTFDITNDLRLAAVDRERTRGPVRGLMREAADKLDALLEDLVIAEKARDRARDVADERSRLLETAWREADTWWRRSEKQVDVIADLAAERDKARPDREAAKARLHPALHELDVRITDLPGDCHCNLVAEVILDALYGREGQTEEGADRG